MSKLSAHRQAPDLFGDLPGVGEVAARYAGPSRAVTSTASLRARAEASGLAALNDAETLELLLSRSMPCGAAANAASLLARFGCLRRLMAADHAALRMIVYAGVALDLQLIYDATRRLAASICQGARSCPRGLPSSAI